MSKLPENNLRSASATAGASGKVLADRFDGGGRSDSTTGTSVGNECSVEALDLPGKHRKRQFWRLKFRMPHLFPLVAVPAVVSSVVEQLEAVENGEFTASEKHVVGVTMAAHQCMSPMGRFCGLGLLGGCVARD